MPSFGTEGERRSYERGYADGRKSIAPTPPTVQQFHGCAWCEGKVMRCHVGKRGHKRYYKYCSAECDGLAVSFRDFFMGRGGNKSEWNFALADKEMRAEFEHWRKATRLVKEISGEAHKRIKAFNAV